jgi:acetyltransferase-like isoleucine patch superfamily enzyme
MKKIIKFTRLTGAAIQTLVSLDTWRWQFRIWEFFGRHNIGAIGRLGSIGPNSHVEPTAKIGDPENVFIGDHCHINHMVCIQAGDRTIRIGDDLRCGPGTMIFATNYELGRQRIRESRFTGGDINIGNDVWLGAGVVVTSGVSIGDHCVIAAGAVVTRNIPACVIAGGVPAKVLAPRPGFESEFADNANS